MKTKVYRVTLLIVDHDDVGEEGVRSLLENTSFPNHAINPDVLRVETREVEWSDDHPLNRQGTCEAAYRALFGERPG